ncbi:MAG: POT family MFS transporter [Planctomycetes bacterium]|nr:POT family MFS transporter [Planctomycetota bacterium]MBL7146135.1 POT family MFS transporter [Phycisphaerae bacterium]
MAESKYLRAPVPSKKMPAGIPYILTNEASERFSFYGSRCILVFFMTHLLVNARGQLAPMTPEQSKTWFHLFVSAVYFMPLLGALISDIWLSKYRTILYFSILYCFGFLALAVNQTRLGLAAGLILIAVGSGIIKPCVSANVGDQFGKTNKHLINRVYHWFYFAINLGAFISNLLIPELLDRYGPAVAFGVPGAFMILATIAFWLGRKKFVHIPRGGIEFVKDCFGGEGIKAIGKLCIIYVFVAPFWALFDQMDSAWMLQAEKMNRNWLGHQWLPTQIVALNPLLILILIPVFSYVIYPAINRIFPLTALRKIGLGLLLAASPFVVSSLIETGIVAGGTPSIGWMFLAYALLTSAEIMVSITCLDFSYTQAPKKMKSFIMAVFLLSISLGNAFTAAVNIFIQNEDGTSKLPGASYYWFFAIVMLVTAVIFIPVARWYKPKEYIQDETSAKSSV